MILPLKQSPLPSTEPNLPREAPKSWIRPLGTFLLLLPALPRVAKLACPCGGSLPHEVPALGPGRLLRPTRPFVKCWLAAKRNIFQRINSLKPSLHTRQRSAGPGAAAALATPASHSTLGVRAPCRGSVGSHVPQDTSRVLGSCRRKVCTQHSVPQAKLSFEKASVPAAQASATQATQAHSKAYKAIAWPVLQPAAT